MLFHLTFLRDDLPLQNLFWAAQRYTRCFTDAFHALQCNLFYFRDSFIFVHCQLSSISLVTFARFLLHLLANLQFQHQSWFKLPVLSSHLLHTTRCLFLLTPSLTAYVIPLIILRTPFCLQNCIHPKLIEHEFSVLFHYPSRSKNSVFFFLRLPSGILSITA